jgi:hypothetical protein
MKTIFDLLVAYCKANVEECALEDVLPLAA